MNRFNNQQVIRQGFIDQRSLLDVHSMRPFINKYGEVMCSYPVRMEVIKDADGKIVRNKKTGEPKIKVIYQNRRVFKNALLRQRDWEQIDAAIRDVMRQPLVGLDDLRNNNLTQALDGLGVTLSTYDQIGDMSPAGVHMNVMPHKVEKDRPEFSAVSVPIPVISKPFTLDLRTLDASRRNGHEGLDVTGVRIATIKVREAIDDIIFNGSTIQLGAYKIYGYTNHPSRIADTAANFGGGDWGTDTNPHLTLTGMVQALNARGFYGPFGVYAASTQFNQTLALTGTNKTDTQLSVIQRTLPDIKFIRKATKLADGVIVMAQLTKETVDIAIGQDITSVSWQDFGGLVNEFMVLAAMAPRFKDDSDGNLGVAHATGA